MRNTNFWQSSAARTALLYFILYAFSSLLTFVVLYISATHDLWIETREAVEQDVRALTTIYENQGEEALVKNIVLLSNSVEARRSLYLLETADGSVIAGNAPTIEPFDNWQKKTFRFDGSRSDHFFVYGKQLGQLRLFVGRRAHNVSEFQESILRSFGIGFAVSIPLTLAGIIVLARRTSRRVDGIAREMEAYIDGNLSCRVPVGRRHDEVDRLAGNINILLSRIERLVSSLKQVTTDVAHDLRTPLSRLRQRLEAVSSTSAIGNNHGEQGHPIVADGAIEEAVSEVDAIIDTFDALLQIAELDAGVRGARMAETDLFEIARFLAETYESVAEDRGQHLSFRGDAGAVISGDRRLLTQLLANLLENALRHTPAGSQIQLAVTKSGSQVALVVADSGPGVPKEEREKVFDRFYRLDASRTTPGSGLGLPLVKAIAELHGAAIDLSDNHPGLAVSISFPTYRPH